MSILKVSGKVLVLPIFVLCLYWLYVEMYCVEGASKDIQSVLVIMCLPSFAFPCLAIVCVRACVRACVRVYLNLCLFEYSHGS